MPEPGSLTEGAALLILLVLGLYAARHLLATPKRPPMCPTCRLIDGSDFLSDFMADTFDWNGCDHR